MSAKLSHYNQPLQPRSSLLRNTPDAIPPTEELELLHAELKQLKQQSLERAKKAGEDLRTIEESMRRMKEREKGKAKATDKIKRERDYTPVLDSEDGKLSSSLHAHPSKQRLHSHTNHSVTPSSARSSLDPRRSAIEDGKKKKKKRKREFDDSDLEHETQRPRKATPPVTQVAPHPHPPKIPKSTTLTSQPHNKIPPGPDFTLPPPYALLPPRPPIPPPPIPGPSKPTDVTEDFSKLKPPAQIQVTSFYTSIEPWIRGLTEEDVGFLEYTADEVEPFVMPKLGRHYTEIWEDQDSGMYPPSAILEQQDAGAEVFAAPVPKWEPSTLMEGDLLGEERGHGPLTERVISALLPMPDVTVWKGVKAAEDAMEGRPGGSGAAAARREKMNVVELEARIRDTMRLHGMLDGVPDFTEKVDDPIATALRHAQRELRQVLATNKARKERLVAIARDRLGYQEYLELRDSIDKNISTTFAKLQKKDGPKLGKKKKKVSTAATASEAHKGPGGGGGGGAGGGGGGAGADGGGGNGLGGVPPPLPPCPAALGLMPDEENRLLVSEQLKQLVETRRQWVDTVGAVFEQKQRAQPGRIWGLPKESVFMGVEEEVRALLNGGGGVGEKEKEKDGGGGGDAMDVG